MVRLRSTLCRLPLCDSRTDRDVSATLPGCEMGILPPLVAGRRRARARDPSTTAADRTIVRGLTDLRGCRKSPFAKAISWSLWGRDFVTNNPWLVSLHRESGETARQ